MTFRDLAENASQSVVGWTVAGILAGIAWLVRRIFTNQRAIHDNQIANENAINLLSAEIGKREALRQQDREHQREDRKHVIEKIAALQASVEATQDDVKKLYQRRST